MNIYLRINRTGFAQKRDDSNKADAMARHLMELPEDRRPASVTVEMREPAKDGSAAEELIHSTTYYYEPCGYLNTRTESPKWDDFNAQWKHIRHLLSVYRSGDSTARDPRFPSLHFMDALNCLEALDEHRKAAINLVDWDIIQHGLNRCRASICDGLRATGRKPEDEDTWLATGKLDKSAQEVA